MSSITDKMKSVAFKSAMKTAISYLDKDPDANAIKVMNLVDKFMPADWYVPQRAAIREAIETKNNWYQVVEKVWDLDPGVRKAFFTNFMVNASLSGSAVQEDEIDKEGCNIPWAILMDPTTACNLHCTGCWAAEYGNRLNLSFEDMDSIVTQGKALKRVAREACEDRLVLSARFLLVRRAHEAHSQKE